eukprot:1551195-Amphidinium_carterae.1
MIGSSCNDSWSVAIPKHAICKLSMFHVDSIRTGRVPAPMSEATQVRKKALKLMVNDSETVAQSDTTRDVNVPTWGTTNALTKGCLLELADIPIESLLLYPLSGDTDQTRP